jgi:hypothetical protein
MTDLRKKYGKNAIQIPNCVKDILSDYDTLFVKQLIGR